MEIFGRKGISWNHFSQYSQPILVILLLFIVCNNTPAVNAQYHHRTRYSKHLASCYKDNDCESDTRTYLRCHERVCQCPRIYHFDEELNRCLIRVGGSCTVGSKDQFCVAYATCHPDSKSVSTGKCKCRSRFWENIDNLCVSGSSINKPYLNVLTLTSLIVVAIRGLCRLPVSIL